MGRTLFVNKEIGDDCSFIFMRIPLVDTLCLYLFNSGTSL